MNKSISNASTVSVGGTPPLLLDTVVTPVAEQKDVCTCSSDTPSTVITMYCEEKFTKSKV